MSSAPEVSPSVNEIPERPELVEINNCVRDTLASLDIEGVEFFLELDGETLMLTLQTKKFLEAQDLAVQLGKQIEQIAPANILELAVYKRKTAENKAFLIKEMALNKQGSAPASKVAAKAEGSANIDREPTKSIDKKSSKAASKPQDRSNPAEVEQQVRDICTSLDLTAVEFFIEIEGETISVIVQTKEFLEAQDLAANLGKQIELIASADIKELAVYKRKNAETKGFLVKKMALKKHDEPEEEEEFTGIPDTFANARVNRSFSQSSAEPQDKYRPKLRMYGMLNSYLIRMFSGFFALGVGIFAVYGLSRLMDSIEQKPLTNIDVNQLPGLGTTRNDPEVMEYQVSFPRGTHVSKFVVYLPTNPTKPKLPSIFFAPSGKTPLYGRGIDEMSHWNNTSYAKAGYAVIAYDVDTQIEQMSEINEAALLNQPSKPVTARLRAYKASDAGVLNAKLAIDYAIARIPQIDPNAIYTAGNGAGGTLSLMVAATDKRVKGAIAFTPIVDLPKKYPSLIENISKTVPGYKEFIDRSSPYQNASKIDKPLFIYHDDSNTLNSLEDTNSFVELVGKTNSSVTFAHGQENTKEYWKQSEINSDATKQAIDWLNIQQPK